MPAENEIRFDRRTCLSPYAAAEEGQRQRSERGWRKSDRRALQKQPIAAVSALLPRCLLLMSSSSLRPVTPTTHDTGSRATE
jgi:hypothetical protein